jgi:hypothetical protein
MVIRIILLVFIAGFTSDNKLHAQTVEKDVILQLMWEKQFAAPILDYAISKESTSGLEIVIMTDKVQFLVNEDISDITTKNYQTDVNDGMFHTASLSKNGKYVRISKHHYANYGRIQADSEFRVYNNTGNLLTTRKPTPEYIPGWVLNNGAFFVSGVLEDSRIFLEQLNGDTKMIFPDIGDMRPSGAFDVANNGRFFVFNISGIGVIYYNDEGNEIWRRHIENNVNATVAISNYGKYVACFRGELSVFSHEGKILWEKKFEGRKRLISFSPDEEFMAISTATEGVKLFEAYNGQLIFHYSSKKICELSNDVPAQSIFSISMTSEAKYMACVTGGGTGDDPDAGVLNVLILNEEGNLIWIKNFQNDNRRVPTIRFSDDDNYLYISNENHIHCYKFVSQNQDNK